MKRCPKCDSKLFSDDRICCKCGYNFSLALLKKLLFLLGLTFLIVAIYFMKLKPEPAPTKATFTEERATTSNAKKKIDAGLDAAERDDYSRAVQKDFIEKMQTLPGEQQILWGLYHVAAKRQDYEEMVKLIQNNIEIAQELQKSFERFGGQNAPSSLEFQIVGDGLKKLILCIQGNCPERRQPLIGKNQELDDLYSKGDEAFRAGNYEVALTYWNTCLQKAQIVNDKEYIQTILNSIGFIYLEKKEYEKAIKYFKNSVETLSIQDGGNPITIFGNLCVIARTYLTMGKREEAIEYFQQALDISTITGICEQEIDTFCKLKIEAFYTIAKIYESQGKYQQAIDYLHNILNTYNKLGDEEGQVQILMKIAMLYQRLGDLQEFEEYVKRALDLSNKDFSKLVETILDEKQFKLVQNMLRGDYEKVLDDHYQKLEKIRKSGDCYSEGLTLADIGLTYMKLNQYEKALQFFNDAKVILIQENALDGLWRVYRDIGIAYAKLNLFEEAISSFEQSIDTIEFLGNQFDNPELKHLFRQGQDRLEIYDTLIELLYIAHEKESPGKYAIKSFEIFERKQGRMFLDMMGESVARNFSEVTAEIIQREEYLNKLWEGLKSTENTIKPELAQDVLKHIQDTQESLKRDIRTNFPDYYALRYPQPVTLEELQKHVLHPEELMLVYNIMKKNTILWLISPDTMKVYTLPVSEEELQKKVADLRRIMEIEYKRSRSVERYSTPEEHSKFAEASHDLYMKLIPEEVRPLLTSPPAPLLQGEGGKTLYVVPTGPLYALPFEALITQPADEIASQSLAMTPRCLIEDIPICYLSSASLLKTLREAKARRKETAPYPLLAFADPVYQHPPGPPQGGNLSPTPNPSHQGRGIDSPLLPGEGPGVRSLQALRNQVYQDLLRGYFKELPETAEEAEAIKVLLNAPDQSDPLQLREKASRSNVFAFNADERLDDYQYLVFATHGVLPGEVDYINQPALVLSFPENNGYLTMADVFQLQLNAKLVSLSACNTGSGEQVRGEGVMGLTRAFMYDGTPAIGVTLWSVETFSAKELDVGLFEHIKAGKAPIDALRAIKLQMLHGEKGKDCTHPYYWAPFVLFGDGR